MWHLFFAAGAFFRCLFDSIGSKQNPVESTLRLVNVSGDLRLNRDARHFL